MRGRTAIIHDGLRLHVTPSIGIALYPDHAVDPELRVAFADPAMYVVKQGGSGRQFFAATR